MLFPISSRSSSSLLSSSDDVSASSDDKISFDAKTLFWTSKIRWHSSRYLEKSQLNFLNLNFDSIFLSKEEQFS